MQIKEGGLRALATYQLSSEELEDRYLDFIGGFEIIDDECRVFVLEGLQAFGMAELERLVPRDSPNSDSFKILKNKELTFKTRLYQAFNLDLKKIRLRDKLNNLLISPNIYLRTKVPDQIQQTLV